VEIMESTTLNEGEVLSDKLEKAVRSYDLSFFDSEKKQQNLLHVLQNNDCRGIIAKCVDGFDFSKGFTCAVARNHPDVLKAYIEQGMNVDVKNEYGRTALTLACMNGFEHLARLLLSYHANPNVQNNDSWTALMWASSYGFKDIVQLLLDHDADVTLRDNDGRTASDLSENKEIQEMIQNHVNTSYVLK